MKSIIKDFEMRLSHNSKKSIISRVLDDLNTAFILALSFDEQSSDTCFFEDFVNEIDYKIVDLKTQIDYYEQHKEVSEVSDQETK